MWVIAAVVVLLIATFVLNRLVNRDRTAPLERHERALAALRDLAERPRPVVRDVAPSITLPDEHIRILTDGPEGEDPRQSAPAARRARAAAASVNALPPIRTEEPAPQPAPPAPEL